MSKPIPADFEDPTETEKRLAQELAEFDYFDKPVDRKRYPSVYFYVNEWWQERYIPVVRWLRKNR